MTERASNTLDALLIALACFWVTLRIGRKPTSNRQG